MPFSESGKRYSVVVSNRVNSVTSRQATLTVTLDSAPPGISMASGGGCSVIVTFLEPLGPANWNDRGHHYDIVIDTDQDPATGTWDGGDVLIEDGGVYRLAGGWTQGIYQGGDVAIAPGETPSTDFEFRISRSAKHQTDSLPAFPNPSVNVFIVIQSTGWSVLDRTAPPIPYTFVNFPPLPVSPGPITVKRVGSKVELAWPGSGVLETRASLSGGSWAPVTGAASGIQIDPNSASAGYYRLRQ